MYPGPSPQTRAGSPAEQGPPCPSCPHPIDDRRLTAPPEDLRAVATYHKALADPDAPAPAAAAGPDAGHGHRADRARRPVAAARLVAPAPAQGSRRRRHAARRPRSHLHARREALDYFRARERDLLGLAG